MHTAAKPHAETHVTRAIAFDAERARPAELLSPEGLRELVRNRPLLAFTGAGAIGAALGGIFFPRLGRLAFLVVAGFAANELLQRQRALDVHEVMVNGHMPFARPERPARADRAGRKTV
jgi:hypothetical protein